MIICSKCGSSDIKVEEKTGRKNPPKKLNSNKRISYKCMWNIYTCICGNSHKEFKN